VRICEDEYELVMRLTVFWGSSTLRLRLFRFASSSCSEPLVPRDGALRGVVAFATLSASLASEDSEDAEDEEDDEDDEEDEDEELDFFFFFFFLLFLASCFWSLLSLSALVLPRSRLLYVGALPSCSI